MKDSKSMRLEIFNNLELIRRILPSARQTKLIALTSSIGHVTSVEIAGHLGISIPSASQQLASLYEKGWLARTDIGHDSGGSYYVYQTIFDVIGDNHE